VIFLLRSSLLFFDKRLSIGVGSLLHELINLLSLSLKSILIFSSNSIDVRQKLNSFLISELLFLHSKYSSFLNLIDYDLSALFLSLLFPCLSLFLLLKNLKSFNFHHKVEFLLLFDVFRFKSFVFFELFVSNSDDFRVEDHLVHLFDVIHLVVKYFLGF
jgi:hypothetical protein